ncbi:hypothetical protein ACEPAG_7695 [Sanghuangporus baumii]
MASQRQRRANCQICTERESKYACPTCEVLYCSVSCYREHKRYSCSASTSASANISIDTSAATVDGNSMNTDMARIESSPSVSCVEDDDSRMRQPSLLVSDGDGASAVQPQLSRLPSTSESGTSVQILLDSGAFPSTISLPHVRQGEPRSGGAGDTDAEISKIGEKSVHLEMQKRMEVEGENTRPVIEAGATLAPGSAESSSRPRRETSSNPNRPDSPSSGVRTRTRAPTPRALRKLTSLKWPYVPDMPSYPDPLTRDDPKPLTLGQYESIARSPAIRRALSSHTERLPALLRALDALRGDARERAIERVLGVAPPDQAASSSSSSFVLAGAGLPLSSTLSSVGKDGLPEVVVDEEDMRALRELAEAVEAAVRGVVGNRNPDVGFGFGFDSDPLGLDWESM